MLINDPELNDNCCLSKRKPKSKRSKLIAFYNNMVLCSDKSPSSSQRRRRQDVVQNGDIIRRLRSRGVRDIIDDWAEVSNSIINENYFGKKLKNKSSTEKKLLEWKLRRYQNELNNQEESSCQLRCDDKPDIKESPTKFSRRTNHHCSESIYENLSHDTPRVSGSMKKESDDKPLQFCRTLDSNLDSLNEILIRRSKNRLGGKSHIQKRGDHNLKREKERILLRTKAEMGKNYKEDDVFYFPSLGDLEYNQLDDGIDNGKSLTNKLSSKDYREEEDNKNHFYRTALYNTVDETLENSPFHDRPRHSKSLKVRNANSGNINEAVDVLSLEMMKFAKEFCSNSNQKGKNFNGEANLRLEQNGLTNCYREPGGSTLKARDSSHKRTKEIDKVEFYDCLSNEVQPMMKSTGIPQSKIKSVSMNKIQLPKFEQKTYFETSAENLAVKLKKDDFEGNSVLEIARARRRRLKNNSRNTNNNSEEDRKFSAKSPGAENGGPTGEIMNKFHSHLKRNRIKPHRSRFSFDELSEDSECGILKESMERKARRNGYKTSVSGNTRKGSKIGVNSVDAFATLNEFHDRNKNNSVERTIQIQEGSENDIQRTAHARYEKRCHRIRNYKSTLGKSCSKMKPQSLEKEADINYSKTGYNVNTSSSTSDMCVGDNGFGNLQNGNKALMGRNTPACKLLMQNLVRETLRKGNKFCSVKNSASDQLNDAHKRNNPPNSVIDHLYTNLSFEDSPNSSKKQNSWTSLDLNENEDRIHFLESSDNQKAILEDYLQPYSNEKGLGHEISKTTKKGKSDKNLDADTQSEQGHSIALDKCNNENMGIASNSAQYTQNTFRSELALLPDNSSQTPESIPSDLQHFESHIEQKTSGDKTQECRRGCASSSTFLRAFPLCSFTDVSDRKVIAITNSKVEEADVEKKLADKIQQRDVDCQIPKNDLNKTNSEPESDTKEKLKIFNSGSTMASMLYGSLKSHPQTEVTTTAVHLSTSLEATSGENNGRKQWDKRHDLAAPHNYWCQDPSNDQRTHRSKVFYCEHQNSNICNHSSEDLRTTCNANSKQQLPISSLEVAENLQKMLGLNISLFEDLNNLSAAPQHQKHPAYFTSIPSGVLQPNVFIQSAGCSSKIRNSASDRQQDTNSESKLKYPEGIDQIYISSSSEVATQTSDNEQNKKYPFHEMEDQSKQSSTHQNSANRAPLSKELPSCNNNPLRTKFEENDIFHSAQSYDKNNSGLECMSISSSSEREILSHDSLRNAISAYKTNYQNHSGQTDTNCLIQNRLLSHFRDMSKDIKDKLTSGKDMASVLYGPTWEKDRLESRNPKTTGLEHFQCYDAVVSSEVNHSRVEESGKQNGSVQVTGIMKANSKIPSNDREPIRKPKGIIPGLEEDDNIID